MKEILKLMLVETYTYETYEDAYEDFWQNGYNFDYVAFEQDVNGYDPKNWRFMIKYYNKVTVPPTEEEVKNSPWYWSWERFYSKKPE